MGIDRGVAEVALSMYDNKVEAACNYVFDQLAQEEAAAALIAQGKDFMDKGTGQRKAAIEELKANYLPDWVLVAMSSSDGDPVASLKLIKAKMNKMPDLVKEYKIAVGELSAAPITKQNSTDQEQRDALKRFEKMLSMGIPEEKVKARMVKAGVDPSLMELLGFLPCLTAQLKQWEAVFAATEDEAANFLPAFEQGADEISRLEKDMNEISKERNADANDASGGYWRGGEGAAGDLTPAALRRLKQKIEAKRRDLDVLIENPSPDMSFFIGTGGDGADY